MIKFGIPSVNNTVDQFPDEAVLTVHAVEKPNSKRKFSLSRTAAEQLGVNPGLSKVGFSFDGGRYIAVIPDSVEGIPSADRFLVNKELSFMNKKAHDYFTKKYNLDNSKDNHINIESVSDMEGIKVGSISNSLRSPEVEENTEVEETVTSVNDKESVL